MRRATLRAALGDLITDKLEPLSVPFVNGWPTSAEQNREIVFAVAGENDLEYPAMTSGRIYYRDEFTTEYVVQTRIAGKTSDQALLRCETMMQAVIDAALEPTFDQTIDTDLAGEAIDCLVTTVAGPWSEPIADGTGYWAYARVDVAIEYSEERQIT